MLKLSEIPDDTLLGLMYEYKKCSDEIMGIRTAETIVHEIDYIKSEEFAVVTMREDILKFDLSETIEQLGKLRGYGDDWFQNIMFRFKLRNIDIANINKSINNVFVSAPTYFSVERVEIDI